MPTIDPEFAALLPKLTHDEFDQLEANILAAGGATDELVCWGDILVDGHNRLVICQKHGLPFKVRQVEFADREAVKLWMIDNQFGRRNWTRKQASYLRGKEYNMEKKTVGNPAFKQKGQIVPIAKEAESTAKRLAKKHGVSEKTIKRDAKLAAKVDALPPEERQEALAAPSSTDSNAVTFKPDEMRFYREEAKRAGLTVLDWMRGRLPKRPVRQAGLCLRCSRLGTAACLACKSHTAESMV